MKGNHIFENITGSNNIVGNKMFSVWKLFQLFFGSKEMKEIHNLVLSLERYKRVVFRNTEKHGILVLDLEDSNYLPHTHNI